MNRQQASLSNREKKKRKHAVAFIAILGFVSTTTFGCKSPVVCCNPRYVADQIFHRTSTNVETVKPCTEVIPAGVVLEDGLDEAEAIATGLANNSLFQAALAQLGMAGGDAVQASLIANPQVLMYFPSGAKEGQYTLYAPIESYFLRPTRVKVANREYRRIGDQLVQNGLNVARDIRVAYVDLALASEQSRLANEAVRIRSDIANLTRDRFKDGAVCSHTRMIPRTVGQRNKIVRRSMKMSSYSQPPCLFSASVGCTDALCRVQIRRQAHDDQPVFPFSCMYWPDRRADPCMVCTDGREPRLSAG
jgi:hypothetical protein